MPRRPSFRRDNELQRELKRVNKLVQNKQSRLRVGKGLEVQGFETVKPKAFNSRKEINQYLKHMNQFLDKNADFEVKNESGANLKISDVKSIEKTIRRVNKQKKDQWEKVKDLEYTHKGLPTGLSVRDVADPKVGIGAPKFSDFKPIKLNFSRFRSEKEFKEWAKEKEQAYGSDWLEKRNNLYKENYLKSIKNNLGDSADHIHVHIENMSMNEFISKYYTENNAHIDFLYDKVARGDKIKELNRTWGVKET